MKLNFVVTLPTNEVTDDTVSEQPPHFAFEVLDDSVDQLAGNAKMIDTVFRRANSKTKMHSVYNEQLDRVQKIVTDIQNELNATSLWIGCLKPENIVSSQPEKERFEALCELLESEVQRLKTGSNFIDYGLNRDYSKTDATTIINELKVVKSAFKGLEAEIVLKDSKIASFGIISEQNDRFLKQQQMLEANIIAMRAKLDATMHLMAVQQKTVSADQQPTETIANKSLRAISDQSTNNNVFYQAKYEEALADTRRSHLKVRRLEQTIAEKETAQELLMNKLSEMATLQRLLNEANLQIKMLSDRLNGTIEINERLNDKIVKLRQQNADLFAAQDINAKKRQKLQEHIEYLESVIREAQRRNDLLLQRIKLVDEEKNGDVTTMTETLVTFEQREASMMSEKSMLARKISELDEQLRLSQTEAEIAQQESKALRDQLHLAEGELTRKNYAFSALEKQFFDQNESVLALRNELQGLHERIAGLEQACHEKDGVCMRLSAQKDGLCEKVKLLEHQNAELRDRISEMSGNELQLSKLVRELRTETEKQKVDNSMLQAELDIYKKKDADNNYTIQQQTELVKALQAKLADAVAKRGPSTEEIETKKLLEEANKELERLRAEIVRLNAFKKESETKQTDLEKKLAILTEKEAVVSKENGDLKAAKESLQLQLKSAEKAIQNLQKALTEADRKSEARLNELNKLKAENENLKSTLAQLRSEFSVVNDELNRLRTDNAELESQISSLKIENRTLTSRITIMTSQVVRPNTASQTEPKPKMETVVTKSLPQRAEIKAAAVLTDEMHPNVIEEKEALKRELLVTNSAAFKAQTELTFQIHQMTIEIERLKAENEHLNSVTSELTTEISAVQTERLLAAKAPNDTVSLLTIGEVVPKKEIAALTNQNEYLKKRVDNLEALLSEKHKSLLDFIARKTGQVPNSFAEELQTQRSEAEQVPLLKDQIATLKTTLELLEKELNDKSLKLAEFEGKQYVLLTDEMRLRIADYPLLLNRVTHLSDQLSNSSKIVAEIKSNLTELQRELIAEKERNSKDQTVPKDVHNEAVQRLSNELQTVTLERDGLKSQIDAISEELGLLQFALQTEREKSAAMIEEEKKRLSEAEALWKQKLERKREKSANLKRINEDLEAQIGRLNKLLESAGFDETGQKRGSTKSPQSEVELLAKENKKLRAEIGQLIEQIDGYKKLFEDQRKPINLNDELRNKIEETSKVFNELITERQKAQELKGRVEELEKEAAAKDVKMNKLLEEMNAVTISQQKPSHSEVIITAIANASIVSTDKPVSAPIVLVRKEDIVSAGAMTEQEVDPKTAEEGIRFKQATVRFENEISVLKQRLAESQAQTDKAFTELKAIKTAALNGEINEETNNKIVLLKNQVETLKAELSSRDAKIAELSTSDLQNRYQKIKDDNAALRFALIKGAEGYEDLKNAYHKLQSDSSASFDKINNLENERNQLAVQLRQTTTELEAVKKASEEERTELMSQIKAGVLLASGRIAQLDEQCSDLIAKNRNLESKLTELTAMEAMRKRQERQVNSSPEDDISTQLNLAIEERNALSSLLSSLQNELSKMSEALAVNSVESNKLGLENKSIKIELENTNVRLNQRQLQFSELNERYYQLKLELEKVIQERDNLQQKVNDKGNQSGTNSAALRETIMENNFMTAQSNLREAKAKLVTIETETMEYKDIVIQKSKEIQSLNEQLQAVKGPFEDAQRQIKMLQNSVEQLSEKNKEHAERASLSAQLTSKTTIERQKLISENKEAQKRAEQLSDTITKLRSELQSALAARDALSKELIAVDQEKWKLTVELQKKSNELADQQKQTSDVETRLQSLANESKSLQKKLEEMAKSVISEKEARAQFEATNKELAKQLSLLQEKNSDFSKKNNNLSALNANLNQKLSKLTLTVDGLQKSLNSLHLQLEAQESDLKAITLENKELRNLISKLKDQQYVGGFNEGSNRPESSSVREHKVQSSLTEPAPSELNAKVIELTELCDHLKTTNNALQEGLHESQKELESKNSLLESVSKARDDVFGKLKILNEEMERQQDKAIGLNLLCEQLQSQASVLKLTVSALTNDKSELLSELAKLTTLNSDLRKQQEESNDRLAQLSLKLEVDQRQLVLLNEEVKQYAKDYQERASECDHLRNETDKTLFEFQKLKQDHKALVHQIEYLNQVSLEKDQLTNDLRTQNNRLEAEIRDLKIRVIESEKKASGFEKDVEFQTLKNAALQRQIEELRQALKSLRNEAERMRIVISEKTEMVERANAGQAQMASEMETLRARKEQLEEELSGSPLERPVQSESNFERSRGSVVESGSLRKEIGRVTSEMQQKQTIISTMRLEAEDLKRKIENLESDLAAERVKSSELSAFLAISELQSKSLVNELESLRKRLSDISGQNDFEIDAMRLQITNLRSQMAGMSVSIQKLSEEKKSLADANDKLSVEANNLRTEKAEAVDSLGRVSSENDELRKRAKAVQTENEILKAKVSFLSSLESDLREQIQKLALISRPVSNDNSQFYSRINALTQENASLKLDLESTKQRLSVADEALSDSERRIVGLQTENQKMEERVVSLNAQLSNLHGSIAVEQAQNDALKAQVAQLQALIKQLSEQRLMASERSTKNVIQTEVVSKTTDIDSNRQLEMKRQRENERKSAEKAQKIAQKRSKMESDLKAEADQLSKANSNLQDQVERLKFSSEIAEKSNKELSNRVSVLEEENMKLSQQLKAALTNLKAQSALASKGVKEAEALKLRLRRLEGAQDKANINNSRVIIESRIKEIEKVTSATAEERDSLQNKLNSLSSELLNRKSNERSHLNTIRQLRSENQELTEDLSQKLTEIAQLQNEVNRLKDVVADSSSETNELKIKLSEAIYTVDDLKMQTDHLRQEATEKSALVDKSTKERDSLSRRVKSLEAERAVYQESVTTTETTKISPELMLQIKNIPLMATQTVKLKAENEAINKQHKSLISEIDELNKQLSNAKDKETKARELILEKEAENVALNDVIEQLNNQQKVTEAKVVTLEEELAAKMSLILVLKRDFDALKSQLKLKDGKIQELEELVRRLKEQLEWHQREAKTGSEEQDAEVLDALSAQLTALRRQLEEASNQLSRTKFDANGLREQLRAKQARIGEFESKLAVLEKEKDDFESETQRLRIELDRVLSLNKRMESELAALRPELTNARANMQKLREESLRSVNIKTTTIKNEGADPAELARLNRELAQLQSESNDLKLQLAEMEERRLSETRTWTLKTSKQEELSVENSKLSNELASLNAKLRSIENERDIAKQGANELNIKVNQMRLTIQQLEALRTELDTSNRRVVALENELSNSRSELTVLTTKVEDQKRAAAKSLPQDVAEIKRLQDQLQVVQREIIEKTTIIENSHNSQVATQQLNSEINDLRQRLRKAELENQQLQSQISQFKLSITNITSSSETDINAVKQELSTLKSKVSAKDEEINRLTATIQKKEKEWQTLESQYKLKIEGLMRSSTDSSLEPWQDVVGSLSAALKLSKNALENQRGEKVMDTAEFPVTSETVAGYSQNALLQIEKIKKFIKETVKSIEEKRLEAERQKLLASSLDNSTVNLKGIGIDALRELLANAQRISNEFSDLIAAASPDKVTKTASYDVSSDDPVHYIEVIQKYFSDFRSYALLVKETIVQRSTELIRLRKLESDLKLGRVKAGCLEDFKDIDSKLQKSNKLLVEGIKMIGKTDVSLNENRLAQSERPEEWLEQVMADFDQNLAFEKMLLNDVKSSLDEMKKLQKKVFEGQNKPKRFEMSAELQRLVDSTFSLSSLLTNLAAESELPPGSYGEAERISTLKFQTNEDCFKSLGDSTGGLAEQVRMILAKVTDLRSENKRLKAAEKEWKFALKSEDALRSISPAQDKLRSLSLELTEVMSRLGLSTQHSASKQRANSEDFSSTAISLVRLAETMIGWTKDIQNAVSQRKTEIDKLKNLEIEIRATNNREARFQDFMSMAKEAQNLNFLARKILNNDISRYVQEFNVPAQSSDELMDIIYSLNKSTVKYLEGVQANVAKMSLEATRIAELEAEFKKRQSDGDKQQSVSLSINKNTQLLERVSALEIENAQLRADNEVAIRNARNNKRSLEEQAETEQLRSDVARLKKEVLRAEEDIETLKSDNKRMARKLTETEYELERERNKKGGLKAEGSLSNKMDKSPSNRGGITADDHQREVTKLKNQNKLLQEEFESQVSKLKRERNDLEDERDALKRQVDRLRGIEAELARSTVLREELERENTDLRRDVSRLKARV